MKLSRAQRRVLWQLRHGWQVWAVSYGDLDEDPHAHPVMALVEAEEFVGTQPVQHRTLWGLFMQGLITWENLEDYNTIRLAKEVGP